MSMSEIEILQLRLRKQAEASASIQNGFQLHIEKLEAKLAEAERQRDELLGALEKQVAHDKAVSYERCLDCDWPQRCSRKTGCLGIKDHSPIANAAIAAARKG